MSGLNGSGSVATLVNRAEKQGFSFEQRGDKLLIYGARGELFDRLMERSDEVKRYRNGEAEPPEGELEPPRGDLAECEPVLTCMADIEPRRVEWIWQDRIAAGRISLLSGIPGCGKSFVSIDMASRISTATPWPDGSPCSKGSVIIISAEDDPGDTIRPRLDSHRADVSRIHLLSAVRHIRKKRKVSETLFTLADVDMLESSLKQIPDCRLIVIDPIGSYLGGRTDAHKDNEVRAVLAPIAQLAERYGPAVLIVAHRRKSNGGMADDSVLGSRAFTGISRSVWHLMRDQEDPARRLLLAGKSNLAKESSGLAFTIGSEPARVQWEKDAVDMTADDAMASEGGDPGDRSAVDEAADWLKDKLGPDRIPSKTIKGSARADGISARTLDRAKTKCHVIAGPDGFKGVWTWRLPECATVRQAPPQYARGDTLAQCADSGRNPEKTAKNPTPSEPDSPQCANDRSLAHSADTGAESPQIGCDHQDPLSWIHRDGAAYCRGCGKWMGRV